MVKIDNPPAFLLAALHHLLFQRPGIERSDKGRRNGRHNRTHTDDDVIPMLLSRHRDRDPDAHTLQSGSERHDTIAKTTTAAAAADLTSTSFHSRLLSTFEILKEMVGVSSSSTANSKYVAASC